MTDTQNDFILSGTEYFLSQSPNEIYRLKKGEIQVFIVPFVNGKRGIPKLFCEIKDSDRQRSIPALSYVDEDKCEWHLLIKTTGRDASLTIAYDGITSILHKNFLKKASIETYNELGYEKSLLAFYYDNSERPYKIVILSSDKPYLTSCATEAYYLEKGEVFIDIVPLEKDTTGQAANYCEIKDADIQRMFPSLTHTDESQKNWRLQIRSMNDEAILSVFPDGVTDEMKEAFLNRRGIRTFQQEGFENSLVEFYTNESVKNIIYGRRIDKRQNKASDEVANVVISAFDESHQGEYTGNSYYQALQFLCRHLDISLIKAEELHTRCGKNPTLTDIARASHFICRKIVLDADWYQYDCGGFVGTLAKDTIACVPDKKGKYQLFNSTNGSITMLTPELAKQISPQAYSIGRTLPPKSLTKKDIYAFCKKSIKPRDLVPYTVLVIFCSLIGVLLPTLNRMIYDDYIPVGNIGNLTQLCLVMLTFMIGNVSFSIVKNLFGYRVTSRVGNDLQNAVYHRLFHLPESFFRKYDSADLASRISGIGSMASRYANTLVISSISALFSVFYLIRMFTYNSKLTWLSIAIYAVYLIIIVSITSTVQKSQLRIAAAESESSGKLYQYLNGVDKIRMAGVEDRALLSFMRPYSKQQYEEIRVNRLVSIEEALTTIVKSIFSIIIYWYIVKKLKVDNISVGTFIAFNSAFGSFTGALDSLIDEALNLFQIRNEVKRFWDIFDSIPEDDDTKEMPGTLTGSLTLDHVTFAYDKGAKNVLNDVSIEINDGDYIGIVGPSGCGKSTLLKLLLGFETPQSGMVMVDKKDLRCINKGAYRRQLGVVLQNGKLISGTIYENITITAPEVSMTRVNEVVQQVGLKEDIAQMPMGLHTMLSENCNTISGGQQQRILIARAICGKPKILIFDEATSALDNITQAAVSSSLDRMDVTRIVVAHRLSTIKNCHKIIVMNEGKIVQQGTYDELMEETAGLFYALASRQIAE